MKGTILLTAFFLLSGCNSPLLHHVNADDFLTTPTETSNKPSGCDLEFPKSGLCASWTWEKRATDEATGEATLRFWDKTEGTSGGPYIGPTRIVAVKLWMPSMGHGSSPVAVAPTKDASGVLLPGVYSATQIFFSMPGEWEIRVQLREGTQLVEQAILRETI